MLTPIEGCQSAPFAVYRLFDAAGGLLYVGQTGNLRRRIFTHRRQQPWADDIATIEAAWFDTREAALTEEKALIAGLRPAHNRPPGGRPQYRPRRAERAERTIVITNPAPDPGYSPEQLAAVAQITVQGMH